MFTIVRKLPCRRNVKDLLPSERAAYVNAVKTLKSSGGYDPYVLLHQNAMNQGTPPGTDPNVRNAAHFLEDAEARQGTQQPVQRVPVRFGGDRELIEVLLAVSQRVGDPEAHRGAESFATEVTLSHVNEGLARWRVVRGQEIVGIEGSFTLFWQTEPGGVVSEQKVSFKHVPTPSALALVAVAALSHRRRRRVEAQPA